MLNNNGFVNPEWGFIAFEYLEKRFNQTTGEKVDKYYAERDKLKKEMENWSEKRLAAMAGISIEHFNNSIKKLEYLKRKFNYSSVAIFSFVFAYPIYLLICFIVWAIKALKEKDNLITKQSSCPCSAALRLHKAADFDVRRKNVDKRHTKWYILVRYEIV